MPRMAQHPNSIQNLRRGGSPGRPKGSRNRFTNLKDAFLEAFEQTGGVEALVEWARRDKNKRDFYRLVASMLPRNIDWTARFEFDHLTEEQIDNRIAYLMKQINCPTKSESSATEDAKQRLIPKFAPCHPCGKE